MANLKSSQKDIRRTKRRTALNDTMKRRVKRNEKGFLTAISEGNIEQAKNSLPNLQKVLDKAVRSKFMKKGTVNRKKSRLMKKLASDKSAK